MYSLKFLKKEMLMSEKILDNETKSQVSNKAIVKSLNNSFEGTYKVCNENETDFLAQVGMVSILGERHTRVKWLTRKITDCFPGM